MATNNPKLSEAIDRFLNARRGQKKSENTIRLDGFTLSLLLRQVGDILVGNITERHIEDFFSLRVEHGDSDNSLNAHLRALRVFFKWCATRRLIQGNPVADRQAVAVEEKHKFYLPVDQFQALFDSAPTPRDRIICAIGLYLWQRQGEISLIKIGDIDLPRGEIAVTIPKSKRVDYLPISKYLNMELTRWLTHYRANLGIETLDPSWYLVPQSERSHFMKGPKDENGLQPQQTDRKYLPTKQLPRTLDAVQRALKVLGYPILWEGGHTLRRSGARAAYDRLLKDGNHESPIRIIMSMLHHKKMSTTEIYLGLDADRQVRNYTFRGEDMFGEDLPTNVIRLREG